MKNIKVVMMFVALLGVSLASAYYDKYGTWHDNVVEGALDTVTGGRYSDAPQDAEARRKAAREKTDTEKKAWRERQDTEAKAQRKYQDKQAEIQRKKEDRRSRY